MVGIGDLMFTDDYLKEKINFDKFFEKIFKLNGEKFLVHNVNHDGGLVGQLQLHINVVVK